MTLWIASQRVTRNLPSYKAMIGAACIAPRGLPGKCVLTLVATTVLFFGTAFGLSAFAAMPSSQRVRVDEIFNSLNATTPGCVAGVTQNGRLTYAQGFGMADIGERVRMAPDTVLEIGSLSKQFTAASILTLAHDGKLSLDDPVRKYLPNFPSYAEPVTIRELLHHSSGVRDVISLMEASGIPAADAATQQDALAMIERQHHLNFSPDTEYEYSNSGYVLLAEIVRQVTGEPLAEFEADHIFEPFGMTHTFVATREEPLAQNRARSYAGVPTGGYVLDESHWVQIGDGGVNTTIGDFALWVENLSAPSVKNAWLVKGLETRGVLTNGSMINYAGGLFVGHYRDALRISHDGAWQGYRTSFELFPSQHLSLIALCNGANTHPESRVQKMADVMLTSRPLPPDESSEYSVPDKLLAQFQGVYASTDGRQLWEVQVRDGHTVMGPVRGETDSWLEGASPESFTNDGLTVTFSQTAGRAYLKLEPANLVLEQRRPLSATGMANPLSGIFPGSYYSGALQVTWHIVKSGQVFYVKADGANPNRIDTDKQYLVQPLATDVFAAGPYVLEFGKNQFWLFADRASGIHFAKTD